MKGKRIDNGGRERPGGEDRSQKRQPEGYRRPPQSRYPDERDWNMTSEDDFDMPSPVRRAPQSSRPPQQARPRPAAGEPPRRNGRKKRKMRRGPKILLSILLVLVLLVGGAFAWWQLVFKEKPQVGPPPGDQQQADDPNAPARWGADRKEDFYTFLILGRDTVGGGNTDTIMLVSYDVKNQKLNLMSIPRDTMVNVSWDVKKINSVYNNYGRGEEGIQAVGKEVSELIGFVPDFQVVVELKSVEELVNALGGVTFNVPQDMYKMTEDIIIDLKAGEQVLDGQKAMQLIRYRDPVLADLGRIHTQQEFIKAVLKQCLNIKNILKIHDLVKVFEDNVTTNISAGTLGWFAETAILGGLRADSFQTYSMPCTDAWAWSRTYKQNLSYVVPNADELITLINDVFNPYVEPITKSELDIMYINKNGTVGSSTGKLEDTKAATR